MRVAISAENGLGLESPVNPHFGRCPYFVFIDVDDQSILGVRSVANPFYNQHQPGQVPAFVHEQGANVMITGGMGGRAVAFFQECGIQPITGAAGTVRQALEQYLSGKLQGAGPCQESIDHGHGFPQGAEHL